MLNRFFSYEQNAKTPAERTEIEMWQDRFTLSVGLLGCSLLCLGVIGYKFHNASRTAREQKKIIIKLGEEYRAIKTINTTLAADKRGLEATIFMNDFYSWRKDLAIRAKKNPDIRGFALYLENIMREVEKRASTPEEYAIALQKELESRLKEDTYVTQRALYFSDPLLRRFSPKN